MFHDGCTAGPFSNWLNGMIGHCCMAHDAALDASTDWGSFWAANKSFMDCVAQTSGLLALVAFLFVSGPIGWLLYRYGPKRK